jgi:hypothetical protein
MRVGAYIQLIVVLVIAALTAHVSLGRQQPPAFTFSNVSDKVGIRHPVQLTHDTLEAEFFRYVAK